MSRTRRSAWNVASGLLLTLVTLVTGLIATPWILTWLGAERYGAFRVMLDLVAYLAFLDLGLSGSIVARLAPAAGRGDDAAVRTLLAAGLRLYLWALLAMTVSGALLAMAMPFLVRAEAIGAAEVRTAGLVLMIALLLTPSSVFRALAEARQRVYRVSLLLAAQALLTTGLLALTAWLGWGLVGQGIATVIAQVPTAVLLVKDGISTYGAVWRERPSREAVRSIWSLNWPTFIFSLSGRFALHSDSIIVGWVAGPILVTPFVLTQRLIGIAQTQLQGVANATWAGLIELHVQGQQATFTRRFAELTGMISGLGAVGMGLIAAFNLDFIVAWVGPDNYAGHLVTLVACVNAWALAVFSLWHWLVSGTGNIGRWVPYALAFMAVNVPVSVAATFAWGLVGPLVGTLAGFAAVHSWAIPRVMKQIFGLGAADLWIPALVPLSWALPYVGLWGWIVSAQGPIGWAGLVAQGTLGGVGGLLLWWFLGLAPDAREVWRSRLRMVVGR